MILSGVLACSSGMRSPEPVTRPMVEHPLAFSLAEHPTEVRKLWTQKVAGIITDLSVSRDGSAVLVATVPNPDIEGSGFRTHLARYDRSGKLRWNIELEGTVKSQALTDNGALALVSTYDNEVFALNSAGRKLWSIEGMCKPIPVRGGRFLCYHDDDAESDVAFDVYTEQGKKILDFPIKLDILAMKVSEDRRNTAIALTDGQVLLLSPAFKTLWQKKVEGEILDLTVSSGDHPRVAALYNVAQVQRFSVFDSSGRRLADGTPTAHSEQLEIPADGRAVAVYGNSPQGQYLGFFDLPPEASAAVKPVKLTEKWRRGEARFADYASSIIVTRNLVILGFEDIAATARHSHLISFDFNGNLKWNLPLVTEEGAYLYAHGFSPESSLLTIGTDDSYLSVFQLLEQPAPSP